MKKYIILLFLLLFTAYLGWANAAKFLNNNNLLIDPPRICAHIKAGSLRQARLYFPDYKLPVDQVLFKLRCEGKDLMGIVINDLSYDYAKHLRKEIHDYYVDEISDPEKYSQYLLKGFDDRDIFIRVKNGLMRNKRANQVEKLNEMHSEFIEYLTKYPVQGSTELLAKYLVDTGE